MATRKAVKDGNLYYAIVPDYRGEADGVVPKPKFSDQIIYKNTREAVVDGIFQPAECKPMTPNEMGLYVLDTSADDAAIARKVMDEKVKDEGNPIIGPFESMEEAIIAVEEVRPKTMKERLVHLERENEELKAARKE